MRRLGVIALALSVCLVATNTSAANVSWIGTDNWVADATSGSLPFGNGTIDVTISPGTGLLTAGVLSQTAFATSSSQYSNIDTEPYSSLNIQPDPDGPAISWSVEFDFDGVVLTPGAVFNVGQLFVDPSGTAVTELTISMFEADDVTPTDLNSLDFEAHARDSANFDGPITWTPSTGLLTPDSLGAGQNSHYAFFTPVSGEVGRIVVNATTSRGGDLIQFAFAVPEPSVLLLVGAGLLTQARRRRQSTR